MELATLAAVAALELINETYDMLNPASGEDRLGASIHDLWLTMFGPTLMLMMTPLLLDLRVRQVADPTITKEEA